jgi:hypothetical protein
MVAIPADGVAALVQSDEIEEKARTRAVPLPEEAAKENPDEDRHAEAATILRESEQRVTEAAEADTPADVAEEHRRSEDTAEI